MKGRRGNDEDEEEIVAHFEEEVGVDLESQEIQNKRWKINKSSNVWVTETKDNYRNFVYSKEAGETYFGKGKD